MPLSPPRRALNLIFCSGVNSLVAAQSCASSTLLEILVYQHKYSQYMCPNWAIREPATAVACSASICVSRSTAFVQVACSCVLLLSTIALVILSKASNAMRLMCSLATVLL